MSWATIPSPPHDDELELPVFGIEFSPKDILQPRIESFRSRAYHSGTSLDLRTRLVCRKNLHGSHELAPCVPAGAAVLVNNSEAKDELHLFSG